MKNLVLAIIVGTLSASPVFAGDIQESGKFEDGLKTTGKVIAGTAKGISSGIGHTGDAINYVGNKGRSACGAIMKASVGEKNDYTPSAWNIIKMPFRLIGTVTGTALCVVSGTTEILGAGLGLMPHGSSKKDKSRDDIEVVERSPAVTKSQEKSYEEVMAELRAEEASSASELN